MDITRIYHFFPYVEQFPYPGIFLLFILGSVGLPVPEDAVLILCGALVSRNVMLPLPAAIVAYLGVVASDFLIFSFGRRYGRRIVTHAKFHKILSPEKLASLECKFKRHGALLILFGRHLWGFRAKIFLTAGVMGMPPRKFLIADTIAALITVPFMMTVGYKGEQGLRRLGKGLLHPEHMTVAVVILVAAFLLMRHLRLRQQGRVE